jgi:hypothetical protein
MCVCAHVHVLFVFVCVGMCARACVLLVYVCVYVCACVQAFVCGLM